MFNREDNTYNEIREKSLFQWLDEMEKHEDIAVRGGVGDKVRHKVFGIGEIVKVDKVTQTYEIQFENIRGTRRLMFRAELGNVEN